MSLMSSDAQIAREWAERVAEESDAYSFAQRTAARHILATTPPPTMADVEWDDDVHSGLCAEHEDYGTVRMLDHDHHDGTILCLTSRLRHEWSAECDLTPLPGTRVDLTPRRVDSDEAHSTRDESVPRPEHPAVLTTEEDYENAPAGTIVAEDFCDPWVKDDRGFWLSPGEDGAEASLRMSLFARRVLRWGETL